MGVRHGLYAGEKLLERCRSDSSNVDELFHYRISLSSLNNFKVLTLYQLTCRVCWFLGYECVINAMIASVLTELRFRSFS